VIPPVKTSTSQPQNRIKQAQNEEIEKAKIENIKKRDLNPTHAFQEGNINPILTLTIFFPLLRVSSMNLSGLPITSPICHLIHFFLFLPF
jgi:cell division inhibitor SulA